METGAILIVLPSLWFCCRCGSFVQHNDKSIGGTKVYERNCKEN